MRDLGRIPNENPKWIILDGDVDSVSVLFCSFFDFALFLVVLYASLLAYLITLSLPLSPSDTPSPLYHFDTLSLYPTLTDYRPLTHTHTLSLPLSPSL